MLASCLIWGFAALSAVHAGSVAPLSLNRKVATAWFAGWHADAGFPVSSISWSKYTEVTYSFAITTPDVNSVSLEGSNPAVLPQFVAAAHQHGVKAKVSVGGWTGSLYWSTAVGSAANRTAFVKTLTNFAAKYKLDGLDFDWEYPGRQGIGCNTINPSDSANFLAFLQELRRDPRGSKLILTAAVSITPFTGPDGNPLADVSAFSKVLDYIAIMNYDIWGPWSPTVGPNAPLTDACAAPANQAGSATSAIAAWTAARMPVNQLVLGVPAYGHSFRVRRASAFAPGSRSALAAYPPFDKSSPPTGDAWDDPAGADECGNPTSPGGNFNFWGVIQAGLLNRDGSPKAGVPFRFDQCSQTAYVYNSTSEVMISFDNAQAFAAKGSLIRSRGLRGFAMWEAGGDSRDILLDSIRHAAGF
ncbi:hypothetical protein HGRIS_000106 [Hohenbuehelia grisea]|uniref:GH18 domain-containing protein n=1 Tax=Hohenbuehelia grisea TaxID=104357 RepID=A0ABR3JRX6_9AGAR